MPVPVLLWIVFLQLLSHYAHAPLWLAGFILLITGFAYVAYKSKKKSIPFLLRIPIILSATLVFFLYYKTNFSVEMAASFLFLATTLKLLEMANRKDLVVFIFSMLYLSTVSFLFEQNIIHTMLQLVLISSCFYVFLLMNVSYGNAPRPGWYMLRRQGVSMIKMLVLAVPVVVVLFLFFPRISPLWHMPIKTQTATTGISSEMSPGDVSKLAKSSAPAFRVTFDGAVPAKSERYWRGIVLDEFDGRKWQQAESVYTWERPAKTDTGRFLATRFPAYQVIMEPHQQRWLFALEGSEPASTNVTKSDMGVFKLTTDAIQPVRYQMERLPPIVGSDMTTIASGRPIQGVARLNSLVSQDLQVPGAGFNPQTQAYIASLSKRFPRKETLAAYLMQQFSEQEFYYTLEPPLLGANAVDEFLFMTRRGFCEHFASALAYMLRLASIPARVVIGYQGGELNESSNYLLVAQMDAHAWVEAYFQDSGWVRLDPTSMVAPQRILQGLRDALGEESGFLEDNPFTAAAMNYSMLNWFRLKLDELDFKWQSLVVNYHQDQQASFFRDFLGGDNLLRVALFFIYCFIALFVLMILYISYQRFAFYSWAERRYLLWLMVLARFGYIRRRGETPRAFLKRMDSVKDPRLTAITEKVTRNLEIHQYR